MREHAHEAAKTRVPLARPRPGSHACGMTNPILERLASALVALTPDNPDAVEGLRPLYDANMTFRDPIQTVVGLDEFLVMNRRLLGRMRKLRWEIVSSQGTDEELFLEWVMSGAPKLGPSIEVAGVTRARVKDGRVTDHRDYWDMGEMLSSAIPLGPSLLKLVRAPFA